MANTEIECIVNDARELMCKISSGDRMLEDLIGRASAISGKVTCLKEFQNVIDSVNSATTSGARRSILLEELQRETKLIDHLSKENELLRENNVENFKTIGFLVEKYRSLVQRVNSMPKMPCSEEELFQLMQDEKQRQSQDRARRRGYLYKMQEFIKIVEEEEHRSIEYQARLNAENEGLRELLAISSTSVPAPKTSYMKKLKEKLNELKLQESDNSDDDEEGPNLTAVEVMPKVSDVSASSSADDEFNFTAFERTNEAEEASDDDSSSSQNNTILRRPSTTGDSQNESDA